MTRLRMIPRRLAALLAVAAMLAVPAAASAQTVNATEVATSSNWAGYVASGNTFSSVSGTWVVPRAKSDSEGYEATWVGLGGADESSGALEQVGTESDYVNGQATYTAWYELVPKAPVTLKLSVHPGDRMTAKVTVNGTTVVVSISDSTTGKSVTRTLHMTSPDVSSAEWVAEAPSVETGNGTYQVVPLADFGKVTFTSATATTTDGQTGTISDSAWTSQRVDLVSSGGGFRGGPGMGRREPSSVEATTSSLTGSGSRFSVRFNQRA
jgi:hypothetical protein